jgi:anti-sigma B factor antagonist
VNPAEDPSEFAVRCDDATGITVITVFGEIDADEAAQLRADAVAAVERASSEGRPIVVLDLSGVGFIGSVGLSTVLHVHRTAERLGVALRGVTGRSNRAVSRPLQLTGMGARTAWFATLDEAVAAPQS